MTGKLLQVLGALFVIALVGGAVGGFFVLKDRVRVVVAADATATGPDAMALLRDDVQTVARDVAALQQALGSNFERLGEALEQRAEARHADVVAMRKELAAVQQRVVALGQQVDRVGAQLQAMAAPPAATAAQPPARSESPPPGEAVVPPSPDPPAVAPKVEAEKPAKPGFLSFSLPTAPFRFDALQDYTLVSELCRVGFDAKSTLHDFSGVTSMVRGSFRADFDDPQGAWTGDVVATAASLVTGVDGRDEAMREHLDTKNHAEIRFVVARFQPAADGIDVAKRTARGEVAGTMTIRGQSKPFTMPVAIEVDPQQRVVVTGQAKLKLSDYGVPVPSQLGLINMQDEVVVWVALRARVATGARK
jgi:polyisoprenoid-binding protein YceI